MKISSISIAFHNFWSTFPFIISSDPHHNPLIHISINILNLLKRKPRILEVVYALVRRKPRCPVPGLFGAVKSWESEVLHCLPWFAVACQSELRSRFVFLVSQNFRRLEETPPPPTHVETSILLCILRAGVGKLRPVGQAGLLCVFVNKVLLGCSHAGLFPHCLWPLLHYTTRVE